MAIAATARRRPASPRSGRLPRSSLRLLTDFQLSVEDEAIPLPHSVERILAYLGMSPAPVSRARLAASLWPDVMDDRAKGDLRSALWRLRRITGVIHDHDHKLALAPDLEIDVQEMAHLSESLIEDPAPPALDRLADLVRARDILPGWDEEWLVVERERHRIKRLRALERSAEALLEAGEHANALEAALTSVSTDPYRETAHRLVIQIHLAEGNTAEAVRAYGSYRTLVADELGISPSPMMEDLIAPLGARARNVTG
jgi:DNA-binding SARP family transcriptional activator